MIPREDRIEAEVAINHLVQRYALAVDVQGGAAQAACFTAEGFLELSNGTRRDRAAMGAGADDGGARRRHFFTPPVITFASAEEAAGDGFCLILEYDVASGEQKPPLSVDYRDVYARTPDGWLLASRTIRRSFS